MVPLRYLLFFFTGGKVGQAGGDRDQQGYDVGTSGCLQEKNGILRLDTLTSAAVGVRSVFVLFSHFIQCQTKPFRRDRTPLPEVSYL